MARESSRNAGTSTSYQYNKTRLRESILAGIRVPGDPHRDIDGVSVWGAAVAVTRACGSGGGGAPQANRPRCAATPRAVTQNVTRGAAKWKKKKRAKIHSVILLSPLRLGTLFQQLHLRPLHFDGRFWSNVLTIHISVFSGYRLVGISVLFSDSSHFRF